ncbi:NfeD family protein [Solimonas marina]|uniref:NfeD family protein n=1 Tax=Solimonas marina TaxID=2714601 RepID=A0A969W9B4_9GAMM|nr:NfeD family protein [Solimonas marina]NKF21301.1 NfeD family protein [Solimonas marina]
MSMELVYWHWLALGFGLLVLEMFLPTEFVLLWVGVAAIVVGAVAWLLPGLGWPLEFVLWGVLSVSAILLWRRFKPLSFVSDQPTLNRRGESYVGRHFTLGEPIVNGSGTLRVDDSRWRIRGPESLPAGTRVQVIGADGAVLIVEALP